MGFNRFKKNTEAKIGKWHRVSKPLDIEAAAAVMKVKGLVPRAMIVSSAIIAEAERRAENPPPPKMTPPGRRPRGQFMRLTLTETLAAARRCMTSTLSGIVASLEKQLT